MPDTPGKRQRREVKARKRLAKEGRRAARHGRSDEAPAVDGLEGDLGASVDEQSPVGVAVTEPETERPDVVDP